MVTSVGMRQWLPGGTSSMANLYLSLICCFMLCEISLSRMCFLGCTFACWSLLTSTSYALIIFLFLCDFIGLTKIMLLSMSTITIIYLLPCNEVCGNLPVQSENIVSLMSYVYVNISLTHFPLSIAAALHDSKGFLMECMFLHAWFMCPLAVLTDSG